MKRANSWRTPEATRFIEDNRLVMSSRQIGKALGISPGIVQRYLREKGLQIPLEVRYKLRGQALTGRTKYTAEQDRFIRENYLTMPVKQMARAINGSDVGIRGAFKRMGLVIPREIIDQRIQESRRKRGDVPGNKGKKQSEYMSPEEIQRTMATRFQKGSQPKNTKHDLAISTRPDKRGVLQKLIRLSAGKWVYLSRYTWQQAHGPIEKGMKIAFIDGDTLNCELSNLEKISDAELMKRNSLMNLPQPLIEIVRMRGILNRKINKKSKSLKNEK